MPRKTFVPGTLPSADLNTYLMAQVIVTCTSGTRPSSPTSGMFIFETDTGAMRYWNGTAWQPYGSLMASGVQSITPAAANVPQNQAITFPTGLFTSAPNVQVTAATGSPGTQVLGVGVTGISTTGATLVLTATSTATRSVEWLATQTF